MATPRFHQLTINALNKETVDCISISFDIPEHLKEDFQYQPGQYLTLKADINGQEVRRSYSLCTAPKENKWQVAVKRIEDGVFSSFAHSLKVGDSIEVMNPMGNFTSKNPRAKCIVAFAVGSGITPIMSIMKHALASNDHTEFVLFYGNKNRGSIIFKEEIEGLKNKYMERLAVYHILSRESMDVDLFTGRITAQKVDELMNNFVVKNNVDEIFICGPEEMILSTSEQLKSMGITPEKIHLELFSNPDQVKKHHEEWQAKNANQIGVKSSVKLTLDGVTSQFDLDYAGKTILDAALDNGADLPYACKGGVCSTCRAKLIKGEVDMEVNYALTPEEVAKGYILTCQSHPKSAEVHVDFDSL